MTFYSFGKVLCGADIIRPIFLTLKDINKIRHEKSLWLERRTVNKKAHLERDRLLFSGGGDDEARTRDLPVMSDGTF
jgi:hypothetical protein